LNEISEQDLHQLLVEHNRKIITGAAFINEIKLDELINIPEFFKRLHAGESLGSLVNNPPRNEYVQ
jgi:hypothetical protein